MGARFELRHANLMAYITSRSYGAPRSQRRDLNDFLFALQDQARDFLIPERGFELWPDHVSEIARRAIEKLAERNQRVESEVVSGATVERVLEELRTEFSDYLLFALAVGNSREVLEAAERLAREPLYGQLLVLIPHFREQNYNFEVVDPIPAFSVALHAASDWPGMAFWTPNGTSAFVPIRALNAYESPHFQPGLKER